MPFPLNDLTLAEVAEREELVRLVLAPAPIDPHSYVWHRLRSLCKRTASGNANYPPLYYPKQEKREDLVA